MKDDSEVALGLEKHVGKRQHGEKRERSMEENYHKHLDTRQR